MNDLLTVNKAGLDAVPSERSATVNPCTLCAPLGAALVTAGISGAVPLLHGAQGCATYIRRYLISHFREPMDVASSSLGEAQTVFGGEANLHRALDNIQAQYNPQLVTVATTCVAETIGEDIPLYLKRYQSAQQTRLPLVPVATPSYKFGHVEGFHAAVHAVVQTLAPQGGPRRAAVNVLAPIVSPADLRHLRDLVAAFGVNPIILPDYSDALDGVIRSEYSALHDGGTPVSDIVAMGCSLMSIDLTLPGTAPRASDLLESQGVKKYQLGLPIGVRATDSFVETLGEVTGACVPDWLEHERGRLLDAYADGHKYVFGKRVGLYGDPELVAALAKFLLEIGACPVIVATGARNRALSMALRDFPANAVEVTQEDTDFSRFEESCRNLRLDLLIGNSKGYGISNRLGIPLLRLGFPIHDRIGAGRLLSVGYRGTLWLFDSIVNLLLERLQQESSVGYSYL